MLASINKDTSNGFTDFEHFLKIILVLLLWTLNKFFIATEIFDSLYFNKPIIHLISETWFASTTINPFVVNVLILNLPKTLES